MPQNHGEITPNYGEMMPNYGEMTQNSWGNKAKLWGNEAKYYGESPQRQSEYTPTRMTDASQEPKFRFKEHDSFTAERKFAKEAGKRKNTST